MSRILFFILVLIFTASCSITNPYYFDLSEEMQAQVPILKIDTIHHSLKSKSPKVYSINGNEFKALAKKTSNEYKLALFLTFWCPNSRDYVPSLLEDLKKINNLDIVLISPDDWVRATTYEKYIAKHQLNYNIHLLDVYSYGEKRNPHYRMDKFMWEICLECIGDKDFGGFPTFILFDKENHVIFRKSGQIKVEKIISLIK